MHSVFGCMCRVVIRGYQGTRLMKNYKIKYEMDSDPSELFEWNGDGASIGDVLYNFYKSSDEFNYEIPVIIDITEDQ